MVTLDKLKQIWYLEFSAVQGPELSAEPGDNDICQHNNVII